MLDLIAHVAHYFIDIAAGEGLEADEKVAGVLLGEIPAHAQPGAAGITLHVRHAAENLLDLPQQPIRFRQRRAGRRDVIDDEPALIQIGHQVRRHALIGDISPRQQRQGDQQHDPRLRQDRTHQARVEPMRPLGRGTFFRRAGFVPSQEVRRQHGDHHPCDQKGDHQAAGH